MFFPQNTIRSWSLAKFILKVDHGDEWLALCPGQFLTSPDEWEAGWV